jgi:hypothetical protein
LAGIVRIGQHEIGEQSRCYVIAEIGHNHQGSVEKARELFREAKLAGASYADVRVGRYRRQDITTRERQVQGVNDTESYGIGVRTLIKGCWGFAATSVMTRDGVRKAALEAAFRSRAAQAVQVMPSMGSSSCLSASVFIDICHPSGFIHSSRATLTLPGSAT